MTRVVVLHSRYLSGDLSGENRVVDDEVALLEAAGHEVTLYAPSYDPRSSGARGAMGAVWSRRHAAAVRRIVEDARPRVVHVHSLYPVLSPAVLRVVPKDVPIVMTLHNFRYACLPATFVRDGDICEDCLGRAPFRGVRHRCYRGSVRASGALATSLTLHRALGSFGRVSRFLAVSSFVRDKHVQAGLEAARISVKRNFAPASARRSGCGEYLLAGGRLTNEKGFDLAIDAARHVGCQLVLVGDGPERRALERRAGPGTTFAGPVSHHELLALLTRARALVVPSRWYEGSPRIVLEALATGVGIVASRIGGLQEVLEASEAGELVEPRDFDAWTCAFERMWEDDVARKAGEAAHRLWESHYSPVVALRGLEDAYEAACGAA